MFTHWTLELLLAKTQVYSWLVISKNTNMLHDLIMKGQQSLLLVLFIFGGKLTTLKTIQNIKSLSLFWNLSQHLNSQKLPWNTARAKIAALHLQQQQHLILMKDAMVRVTEQCRPLLVIIWSCKKETDSFNWLKIKGSGILNLLSESSGTETKIDSVTVTLLGYQKHLPQFSKPYIFFFLLFPVYLWLKTTHESDHLARQ